MKKQYFFTIKTLKSAGIADQLSQLLRLYRLGKALSFTYVHTPLTFPRSYHLSFQEKLIKKISTSLSIFPHFQIFSDNIADFLGINNQDVCIIDEEFCTYKTVKVPLEDFFEDKHNLGFFN